MKTIPPPCPEPESGPKYWRSLEQLAETPEFRTWVEREFPAGASEFSDPIGRRHFVKIMSASFLLAGLGMSGCRRPEEKILPFGKAPNDYLHGVPQFFATSMPDRGSVIPLLVKSSDGRPTKIEGNREHPASNGGTDVYAQAALLDLYDPDRAMRFTKGGATVSRTQALDFISGLGTQFAATQGEGLSFLLEHGNSPTRARLIKQINEKLPKARWYAYEPVNLAMGEEAAAAAFGQPLRPNYRLEKAKRILSLDCDFLGNEADAYRQIRGFSRSRRLRKASDEMSRLYQVEGLFTVTGINADHRLRVPTSQVIAVAAKIATEILGQNAPASLGDLARAYQGEPKWITECAKDLVAAGRDSVVLAGYRQPLAVHLIAHAINSALGAVGQTVELVPTPKTQFGTIAELAEASKSGSIDTLVILGGNPGYTAPVDLGAPKAKTVVRLGYHEDETFAMSTWHLAQAHFLEAWGDAVTTDGTLVPVQPLVAPLFGGVTEIEILARIAGSASVRPYDAVRETFKTFVQGDIEGAWRRFLHDGFLANSAPRPVAPKFSGDLAKAISSGAAVPAPTNEKLELVFYRDYKLDDGRYNNNGWLQELPDPITKLTWDNVIMLSPATAKRLNVFNDPQHDTARYENDVIELEFDGRKVSGAVWVQPGLAENVVAVALGYGRTATGRVGHGTGFNAYALRTSKAQYFGAGATIRKTGATHELASTQNHWSMEGRPIIREANLKQYRENPKFASKLDMEKPPVVDSLYPNPLKDAEKKAHHQWGMSIDLNACVGCSACMVACQSENNIPIVGKDQVARSREMHWIRIDRYYASSTKDNIETPQAVVQPMLCQHCEAAPCENVCPVNATSHDHEGLNVMTYNRCVGTRYCSNNCPYKVRRFNYFDYNKRPLDELVGPIYKSPMFSTTEGEWGVMRWLKDPDAGNRPQMEWELLKLAKNPDVSVRMRGVMEKCTFCLQRIEQAKIAQKVKAGPSGNVEVPDGTFTTACAQACPAEAIVFGNVADPNSEVSQLKALDRDYTVLDFLYTRPRLTYLARVRNPNPAVGDEYSEDTATIKAYKAKSGEDPFAAEGAHEGHEAHAAESHGAEKGAH
jgi:MoCo/4Fe-4S cofactor protein with predicted Tat translocation signal